MSPSVAVIDIGSNTIKLLVARRDPAGRLAILRHAVEEVRISRGIGGGQPQLAAEAMARGVAAVERLLAIARTFHPEKTRLVATSAVRDAANGGAFGASIRGATGHDLRVLSGEEEANYIGRGLATDPALAGTADYYVFDLGGGSLESLTFCGRRGVQATSLPLGCVRLTERCVNDPVGPFTPADRTRVIAAVQEGFAGARFRFDLAPPTTAIGTGGTVTTARAMLACAAQRPFDDTSSAVTGVELEELLSLTARLPLAARREVPGLPPSRADVFPTAIATLLEVARLAQVDRFVHSLHNLRYGVAAELLKL